MFRPLAEQSYHFFKNKLLANTFLFPLNLEKNFQNPEICIFNFRVWYRIINLEKLTESNLSKCSINNLAITLYYWINYWFICCGLWLYFWRFFSQTAFMNDGSSISKRIEFLVFSRHFTLVFLKKSFAWNLNYVFPVIVLYYMVLVIPLNFVSVLENFQYFK